MKASLVGIALLFVAAPAFADIVAWSDETGVRHFTNVQGEIPADQRASAQVVVNEAARQQAVVPPDAGMVGREGMDAARQPPAPIVPDTSDLAEAYAAGLQRGLQRVQAGGGGGGSGAVTINGPLAIANARQDGGYGGYGAIPWWQYGFLPPQWYPFVTTSFDGGRSRHLTLRMLLQDQFEIDRAAPYVFVERLPPFGVAPLGPNLNVLMPRGLAPYSVPVSTRAINW
jgi:hypothetical protein